MRDYELIEKGRGKIQGNMCGLYAIVTYPLIRDGDLLGYRNGLGK